MKTILTLLACHLAALAVLALPGCGGGGDAYMPVVVAPAEDPKACSVALVKLDGGPAACAAKD